MVTTKKVRQLFEKEKCTARENPGYAYAICSEQNHRYSQALFSGIGC